MHNLTDRRGGGLRRKAQLPSGITRPVGVQGSARLGQLSVVACTALKYTQSYTSQLTVDDACLEDDVAPPALALSLPVNAMEGIHINVVVILFVCLENYTCLGLVWTCRTTKHRGGSLHHLAACSSK